MLRLESVNRFRCVALTATLSFLLAPFAAVPASAHQEAVVDAKFGDRVAVPAISADLARVKVRLQGRAGQGLLIGDGVGDTDPGCETAKLTGAGKTVPRGAMGTWIFPRSGTYVLDYRQSCRGSSSGGADFLIDVTLELRRLVIHSGKVGQPLNTRLTRSTAHAYRVPVPSGPGVRVVGGLVGTVIVEAARMLDQPGRNQRNFNSMCRPRSLITGAQKLGDDCGYRIRRSDDYIVIGGRRTTLKPYAAASANLDKAGASWRDDSPRLLRFSGKAGTFVSLDVSNLNLTSAGYEDTRLQLRGGRGYIYPSANGHSAYGHTYPERTYQELMWELPATGRYAFELFGKRVRAAGKVTANVRTVKVVPLQLGVPTELTVGPDAWTYAQLPEVTETFVGKITVLSTSGDLAPGWRVFGPTESDQSGPVTAVGEGVPFDTPRGIVAMPGAGGGTGAITVRLDKVG